MSLHGNPRFSEEIERGMEKIDAYITVAVAQGTFIASCPTSCVFDDHIFVSSLLRIAQERYGANRVSILIVDNDERGFARHPIYRQLPVVATGNEKLRQFDDPSVLAEWLKREGSRICGNLGIAVMVTRV